MQARIVTDSVVRCHTERAPRRPEQETPNGQKSARPGRVYRLYQDGQLDSVGFGKFYQPLDERRKQLEADIPRLQAEIDVAKVHNISAEEVATEAQNLHRLWPEMEPDDKRKLVESITEKIVVGKGEISITFCYLPPYKDMANGWRKGWDSNPRYGYPYA